MPPQRPVAPAAPRRTVVIVPVDGGRGHRQVEVIRGGWSGTVAEAQECLRVTVRLTSGAVRTERVARRGIAGAHDPGAARTGLLRRMRERGVLVLAARDGTTLSVPAEQVRDLRVTECGREEGRP